MNHFSARYIDVAPTLQVDAQGKVDLSDTLIVTNVGNNRAVSYSDDARNEHEIRLACMKKIEDQATEAWGSGPRAVATRDFMTIVVKRRKN